MINEERVKELYQVALYDQNEEQRYRQVAEYYRNDYISKEIIKSFFSGTIAFVLIVALWVLRDIEGVLDGMGSANYKGIAVLLILLYVVFMAVYLLCTRIVYSMRYKHGREKLKKYYNHLKKIDKMYEREEKLKM